MDMTRAKILEGNINDELWPEPYEAQHQELPSLTHLRILGYTVYVFLHEEGRALKSGKSAP